MVIRQRRPRKESAIQRPVQKLDGPIVCSGVRETQRSIELKLGIRELCEDLFNRAQHCREISGEHRQYETDVSVPFPFDSHSLQGGGMPCTHEREPPEVARLPVLFR